MFSVQFILRLNLYRPRQYLVSISLSILQIESMLITQSPFLAFVSSTEQFDQRLSQYVTSDYVQTKYSFHPNVDDLVANDA